MITIDLNQTSPDGVCKIARRLIRAGHDPETILHAIRGTTVCHPDRPLKHWASLSVRETPERSAHFVRYRAFDLKQVSRSGDR